MKNLIIFIVSMVLFFGSGLLIGCKTLRVIQVEGQPDECNDMYMAMDYTLKGGASDNTFSTLWYTACINARKAKIEKIEKAKTDKIKADKKKLQRKCKEWIFQGDELSEKDYKRYSYYLECIK